MRGYGACASAEYSDSIQEPHGPIAIGPLLVATVEVLKPLRHKDLILCLRVQGRKHQELLPMQYTECVPTIRALQLAARSWGLLIADITREHNHSSDYRMSSNIRPALESVEP